MASSVTIVTAFFDLAGIENNQQRRSCDDYLKHGKYVMGLDVNLVIFIDPIHVEYCQQQRKGKEDKTKIYPVKFQELENFNYLEHIRINRTNNPVCNASAIKDTPSYIVLTWSKFEMLKKTINDNPLNSTHFAWLDFGISHVANLTYVETDNVFKNLKDKVSIEMLKPITQQTIQDRKHYFSYIPGHLAAGYITGGKETLSKLIDYFEQECHTILAEGFGPSEEQIMPILCMKYPELFEFYFGDYDGVLSNYHHQRMSLGNIIFQLKHCRDIGRFDLGYMVGKRVFDDIKNKFTVIHEEAPIALDIINEYFVCSFYNYPNDQTHARKIAEFYVELITHEPFDEAHEHMKDRVRLNLDFLNNKVKIPEYNWNYDVKYIDTSKFKLGFIILRHVSKPEHDKIWIECYKCVREFYNDPILIIDDNSNYEYISNIDLVNTEIVKSEFPGCGELLTYYYFHKQDKFTRAVILHDSMFINRYYDFNKIDQAVKFLWHFHYHDQDCHFIIQGMLSQLNNSKDLIRFFRRKTYWHGCFGAMSIIDKETLSYIVEKYNLFTILKNINTRKERESCERVFAILCFYEKLVNKNNCSIYGDIHNVEHMFDLSYDKYMSKKNQTITKIWNGR